MLRFVWRDGEKANTTVCKTVIAGSSPARASNIFYLIVLLSDRIVKIEQICIFVALPTSGQGVEGFKGRKRLAREPKRSPSACSFRTEPSRAKKLPLHFLFCARRFLIS
jgi:hypothetical protein